MTNRFGINARNLNRLIVNREAYTIIKYHALDRRAEVFGESTTLDGAEFIADSGFMEDEGLYNDCEELSGLGIGFSYLVFDSLGNLVYEKRRINLN